MSLLSNFKNLPVVLQLKEPLAMVHSSAPVMVGDVECGLATLSMMQGKDGPQPVIRQILQGYVDLLDESGVVFTVTGGDGQTPVRMYLPLSTIQSLSFAVEHPVQRAPEQPLVSLS